MADATRMNHFEELTLSNKQEVSTLSRGSVEANERIAEMQLTMSTMNYSLQAIEKLLRDNLKMKNRVDHFRGGPFNEPGAVGWTTEPHWPQKLKIADLPMFDGEGAGYWVF
ncbi:hypothetical protein PIB30_033531 [Stylosanthes scabra]|uniref:Uncharacterized protein n=1 Tax=Stylosanthes scabra TaxID=79078 RepID=A0ABU6SCG4_9FABA|nr:hypothetical protein [Stylosanthes scabra]